MTELEKLEMQRDMLLSWRKKRPGFDPPWALTIDEIDKRIKELRKSTKPSFSFGALFKKKQTTA